MAAIDFGRDKTQVIKGLAIIYMIIHHTQEATGTFVLCVGIFAFMVGYGYFFARQKTLTCGLRRAFKLLKKFWFVLFVFTLPIAMLGEYKWSTIDVLYNMFGISESLNWYSWFLKFYIFAMIVMPVFVKIVAWRPYVGTALSICAIYVGDFILHEFLPWETPLLKFCYDAMLTMPLCCAGYLFAEQRIYQRITLQGCKSAIYKLGG